MLEFGPIVFLVESLMLPLLKFFYYNVFPNYGISIILLTLTIKVAFFPLMSKQYKSMKQMQVIAPEMKALREKLKSKPEKLQQEMLKLYKKHNVNPIKGCLPMLVQIPFFIGIYATILSDSFKSLLAEPGVYQGLFPFWLSDLSAADGTMILPVLLAGFTYWSQKLMAVDPTQKKLLILSPIMILFFGITLRSGVLIYWTVSTVVSTLQQLAITRAQDNNIDNGVVETKKQIKGNA